MGSSATHPSCLHGCLSHFHGHGGSMTLLLSSCVLISITLDFNRVDIANAIFWERRKVIQNAVISRQAEGSVSSRTRNNNPNRRKSVTFASNVAVLGPSSNNGADCPADLLDNDADDEFQSDKGNDNSKDTLALIRKFKLTEK